MSANNYRITIHSNETAKTTSARLRRSSAGLRARKWITGGLTVLIALGGLTAALSASAVNADSANAGTLEDNICIVSKDGTQKGEWRDGKDRYAKLGGKAFPSMDAITERTPIDVNRSVGGIFGGTEETDRKLTAYEKYGAMYPEFTAWVPAYTSDDFSYQGAGDTAETRLDAGRAAPTQTSGSGLMVAGDLFTCAGAPQIVEAATANAVSYIPRLVLGISTTAYEASFGESMGNPDSLMGKVADVLDIVLVGENGRGGLIHSLYLEFLVPVILLAAVWLGFVGIVKKKYQSAAGGMVWMVLAIAAGAIFFQHPTQLATVFDDGLNIAQKVTVETILPVSGTTELCASESLNKAVSCSVWQAGVYSVWEAGQFGVSENSDLIDNDPRGVLKDARVSLGERTLHPDTWAEFMLDRQATGLATQQSEVAYAQLSGDGATPNPVWKGGVGTQLMSALMMWISVPAVAIVPLIFGLLLFLYRLMLVSVVLMLPVIFLVGVIPGYGKRLLLRMAELVVAIFVRSVVTLLILGIWAMFLTALIGGGYLLLSLQIILSIVLSVFALTARAKFSAMFSGAVNFGGDKSLGLVGVRSATTLASVGAGIVGMGSGALTAAGAASATRGAGKSVGSGLTAEKSGESTPSTSAPTMDVKPRKMEEPGQQDRATQPADRGGLTGSISPAPQAPERLSDAPTTATVQPVEPGGVNTSGGLTGAVGDAAVGGVAKDNRGESDGASKAQTAVDAGAGVATVAATPAAGAAVKAGGTLAIAMERRTQSLGGKIGG